ncbi:MAG: cysteine--tRNA ligase [Gemmatimonadetes bacterium]|nr:cysteine--tRNA ligase [Gemmatimonadota bacterium]
MPLKVYNTATRSLDLFVPLEEGRAKVYACGPTIYDHAHIGNFRAFLFYDLVHRYLEWKGYEVRFVMNLTDVDDKTIKGAVAAGSSVGEFTRQFGDLFLADCATLGIVPVDRYPRATDYIGPMIDFIGRLIESGHAYQADDGAVYYSIASFERYGKLKGIDLDSLKVGARVSHDEYEKEDARDFALWKVASEEDEVASAAWDSPWGRGRPGWHLECSVMSVTELGDTLDMHLGGEDLVFPHHENEIAQSEAATGKPFSRNWLHVKHLQLEGRKMSKSLGNFITVRELLEEGFGPASIRHQLLGAHYRSELNFTREGLNASKSAVQRLVDFDDRVRALPTGQAATATDLQTISETALDAFAAAMDDDFNTSDALAALFMFVSRANAAFDAADVVLESDRNAVREVLGSMDRVLGLLEVARASRAVDDDLALWVDLKIQERADARARRDFAAADGIRDELSARNIVLEDGAGGTRWKVVD